MEGTTCQDFKVTMMVPAKVVHIVEDLKLGGLEKIIAAIVTGLDRSKYHPEVWCLARGGEITRWISERGVDVRIFNFSGYYNPLNIMKLSRLLRKSEVDIVHAHAYFAGTFARLAATLARVPVVISHVHTTDYQLKKRNFFIEKALSKVTDKVVCVSGAVQNFVTSLEGIDKKKTTVIYNGTTILEENAACFNVTRESLGLSPKDFVIITVASLVENKGHLFLLEAIQGLVAANHRIKLIIVGEGPLQGKIRRFISTKNIQSHVLLTGKRDDVACLLKLADVSVLASVGREGLGLALIEAMAAGLPLIATKVGGMPEVVENNVNGFLVKPGNILEVRKAINQLMINEKKRLQMGEASRRKYFEKYTSQNMIFKIESLYDRLFASKSGWGSR